MSGFGRRLAQRLLTAADHLLPPHLTSWSRAMGRELVEITDDDAALRFAAGCLRAALGLAIAARLETAVAVARAALPSIPLPTWSLQTTKDLLARPRLLGLLCGVAATAIGMAYLLLAGAPPRHLLVNLAALILGATIWLALGGVARGRLTLAGPAVVALALALLATALFGVAAAGASRWVVVGGLSLQVSLILLPAMLVLYAPQADALGTAGMIVGAVALALQPDRGMAAALAAGLLALAISQRQRLPIMAAAASLLALAWTCLAPDRLPAVPFVDRVLYAAFDLDTLTGIAVLVGAGALVLPALLAAREAAGARAPLLAFGGCWLGVLGAAALGNYPTPVVGYGGSAILGYLLSVALLPHRIRASGAAAEAGATPPIDDDAGQSLSELRVARLG